MTRWLVTGASGMLGHDLLSALEGQHVTAMKRSELDITDAAAVAAAVADHDVIVNAAGWTDVDGAEANEAAATAVNGTGVDVLAQACAVTGARLVHVSTDYVFDGTGTSPYPEDAPTAPINAYGRGKLAGEQAVLGRLPDTGYVVRTAWLYGEHGRNFVSTMLRLADERDHVDVVDDQFGQPTWSAELARQLVALGASAAPAGVYHATAAGQTSWFGFAQAIFAEAGHDPARVRPMTSDRLQRPARRPGYSVLGTTRWATAGLAPMLHWRAMLAVALSKPPFATGR
jgi:dTDP-4-dehydrorhamnose reductase